MPIADPAPADPAKLHRKFAFFEADAGMRRTARHGHQAGQRDAKGGGAEQHPTSHCHPTSANRGKIENAG